MAARYLSGLLRKALASAGLFSSRPSNSERAKVRQWLMLWGKLRSVHMGACFSGGSRDEPAAIDVFIHMQTCMLGLAVKIWTDFAMHAGCS